MLVFNVRLSANCEVEADCCVTWRQMEAERGGNREKEEME